jgi:hypothetical protein
LNGKNNFMNSLPNDLRRLLRFAEAGGANTTWLQRIARDLVAEHLELLELRRCVDPRTRTALRSAHTVIDLADKGISPMQIVKRTGLSKTSVYRYLSKKPAAVKPLGATIAPHPAISLCRLGSAACCTLRNASFSDFPIPLRLGQSVGKIP